MSGFSVKCSHCGELETYDLFGTGGGKKAAEELGVPFLGKIPIELGVREGGDEGLPFTLKNPESASAKAFRKITKQIREFVE